MSIKSLHSVFFKRCVFFNQNWCRFRGFLKRLFYKNILKPMQLQQPSGFGDHVTSLCPSPESQEKLWSTSVFRASQTAS